MGKVTIDDLAIMIQKQFLHQDKEMKSGFAEIKKDISVLEKGQKKLDSRVVNLEYDSANLRNSFSRMQTDITEIKTRVENIDKRTREDTDALASDSVKYDKRIKFVEKQIKSMLAGRVECH